jgi:hypothetical protein
MTKTSGMDLAKDTYRYQSDISDFSLSAVLTASGAKGIISVRIRDTPKVSTKLLEKFQYLKLIMQSWLAGNSYNLTFGNLS